MQFNWDTFKSGRPLPFDLGAAHELYRTLLGPFEDLLAQKSHLLVVPTAPLSGLPFQVLIDRPASMRVPDDAGDYAEASWLIRRLAITVLPSAGSLKGLRVQSRKSRAQRPYLAFANPLLTGRPSANNGHARRAKEARLKQTCPNNPAPPMSLQPLAFAGFEIPEAIASLFRGDLGDPDRLREIVGRRQSR
jgi:CHAT domain-containing protein